MGRPKKKRPFVVRPWSLVPCPTPSEVISAWEHRGDSQKDFIWLLSVLSELTCYTDCHLQQKGGFGNIKGRAGGLKAHLERKIPVLAPKYKSVSRYATLALRLRQAFNFYPPAVLAQLHPDLEHPLELDMPYISNFANKLYNLYFEKLPPTYVAFKEVVDRQMATAQAMKHPWAPAWPRRKWGKVEDEWREKIVDPHALRDIRKVYAHQFRDSDYLADNYYE